MLHVSNPNKCSGGSELWVVPGTSERGVDIHISPHRKKLAMASHKTGPEKDMESHLPLPIQCWDSKHRLPYPASTFVLSDTIHKQM